MQFKAKITPEQVKEKLAKAHVNAEKSTAPEKTLPLPTAEKAAKTKAEPAKKETKAKTEKKEALVEFPVSGHVNGYGFLFLKGKWLKALDWRLDMSVKIERNADGSITVRKA